MEPVFGPEPGKNACSGPTFSLQEPVPQGLAALGTGSMYTGSIGLGTDNLFGVPGLPFEAYAAPEYSWGRSVSIMDIVLGFMERSPPILIGPIGMPRPKE